MRKTLHVVVTSLILLCVWGVSGVLAQSGTERPFITKWQGEAGTELKIPIVGTYKMVIKDESGNEKVNETVTVSDAKHPYVFTPTKDGTYTVAAGPEGVKYMRTLTDDWKPIGNPSSLREVVQFGTVKWESMKWMFYKCENITFAEGINTPDLSNVTDMREMFYGCSAFNQPLNNWNVSNVTNMEAMFSGCSAFNQPLDNWNVSKVTNMSDMFSGCSAFNQPLNNWNVSKVTNMSDMFSGCSAFNQPIGNWDVSKVTNMGRMFYGCSAFNQPIGNWDVSTVTDMGRMFNGCTFFNQPLNNWNVSNVTNMEWMFNGCTFFNQPLNNWNVSNVTNMGVIFNSCSSFNQPIGNWDVSKVTDMGGMFEGCSAFNQPIGNWDVSKVTNMGRMFYGCSAFNQPIGNWDVSKVTNMVRMFNGCSSFNQPLDNWNVSNVTIMVGIFNSCSSFNQPIGNWDVSNVTYMDEMFEGCSAFNQPLDNWNVSKVDNMGGMFWGCSSFNQPIGNWDVSNVTYMAGMFNGCSAFNQPLGSWKIKTAVGGLRKTAMSPSNYSQTLVGWAGQTAITNDLNFGENVQGLIYDDQGKMARQKLIGKGWTFDGDIYQFSGVAITPRFFPLVLNKKCTLSLDKRGVEKTEEVILSTDKGESISCELTEDKKGMHIKGLKEGTCTLTATIAAKPGVHDVYTSTCEIEVYIPIEHFTITPARKTLKVGEEFRLTANIFPENATKREVKWTCNKTEIATIDNNGKVTAHKAGKCTFYAAINEYGRGVYGICEVDVVKEIAPVASITLLEKQTITVGTTIPLIAVVKPDNAQQGLDWKSSDPEIATVSEGLVWGKKKGTCTITVKSLASDCSITKECKITVEESDNGGNNNEDTPTTFSVTLTQPANGKIEIEGYTTEAPITVAKDTTLTVKATPETGYKLKEIVVNGQKLDGTTFVVTAATTVTALFEKETFAVTPSVNNKEWGDIAISGASDLTAVPYDTELTVTITEKEGYKLKTLTAGDDDITETKKFTVKAETTVTALFESKQGDNNKPGAVEDALLAGIVVAPNPFSSQLRILNPEGVVAHYELVNAAGVVVRSGALSGTEVIVDTEALPAGIYFVRLEAQNGAQKSVVVSK